MGTREDVPYFGFGDWIARPAQCVLEREGKRVVLEPKLMDVLAYLAGTGGEVVSTEALLTHCWRGTFYGDNPVHKTIALLRKALGDDARLPSYIATVRKRGYRVVAQVTFPDERIRGEAFAHTWYEGTPFRGLLPFDAQHAPVFFGRARATSELLASVRAQWAKGCAFVLVSGPSGSGKTSLTHAGILPALMREAGHDGLRAVASASFAARSQGLTPCEALAAAMTRWEPAGRQIFLETERAALARALLHDMPGIVERIAHGLARNNRSSGDGVLLLVVETLESLVAMPAVAPADAVPFLAALSTLARSGHVVVLALCRSDFYPRLMEIPELLELKRDGALYDLARPTAGELAQMIRMPALAAGLRFEHDAATERRLDDMLVDAACRRPGALPLLQYTLQALYEMRGRDGELTIAAYRELGGMEGALARRAEQAFSQLEGDAAQAFEAILQRLVSVSSDGDETTACIVHWYDLADDAQQVVRYLVNKHLLVSLLEGDTPCFTVAHEALLRHWPRIVEWVASHREMLRVRARIAEMARRWTAEGKRAEHLLPAGLLLGSARLLYREAVPPLDDVQRLFVSRSLRRVRIRMAAWIGMSGIILVLAVFSAHAAINARRAEASAEMRRADVENLLDFMLGDMHERLDALGRLDLLDAVTGRAMTVLGHGGDAKDSADALRRSRALREVGEIRFARGDLDGAQAAFHAEDLMLQELTGRWPGLPATYAEHGKLEFWLGQIANRRGQPGQARAAWLAYLSDAHDRAALEPNDADAWLELSYANNCLGTAAMRSDQLDEASRWFAQSIAMKRRVLGVRADDRKVQLELADTLSWLSLVEQRQGRLHEAFDALKDEGRAVDAAREGGQPTNLWQYRRALADLHVAKAEADLGLAQVADKDYARAIRVFHALVSEVPDNLNWKRDLAYAQMQRGWLAYGTGDAALAVDQLSAARADLLSLLETDSKIADWRTLLALDLNYLSVIQLRQGHASQAATSLELAWRYLPGTGKASQSATERVLVAMLDITSGEVAAAQGARDAVVQYGNHAVAQLASSVPASQDPRLLDPYVRALLLLGRRSDADPYVQRLHQIGYHLPMYESYVETSQGHKTP